MIAEARLVILNHAMEAACGEWQNNKIERDWDPENSWRRAAIPAETFTKIKKVPSHLGYIWGFCNSFSTSVLSNIGISPHCYIVFIIIFNGYTIFHQVIY